jgi:hypothetical protein
MFKFFRRIRQQLIAQNKFSKYMLYALGEIILVVIGILIALKVNDWNEYKKLKLQEKIYITKLIEDIQTIKNILMFDHINFADESILEAQQALFYVQNCDELAKGKEALENVLLTHGNLGTIYIQETTYSEMVANGAFSRLQNDSLKTTISDLYSRLHGSNEYISYFRDELGRASTIIWNLSEKVFKPNITLDARSQDQLLANYNYEQLCQSPAFKNALAEVYDSRQDVYNMALTIDNDLNNSLTILKTVIKKEYD